MVNPRDRAGNAEEEEWWTPEIKLGTQKKKKNPSVELPDSELTPYHYATTVTMMDNCMC